MSVRDRRNGLFQFQPDSPDRGGAFMRWQGAADGFDARTVEHAQEVQFAIDRIGGLVARQFSGAPWVSKRSQAVISVQTGDLSRRQTIDKRPCSPLRIQPAAQVVQWVMT
jgi:hypothetical protein